MKRQFVLVLAGLLASCSGGPIRSSYGAYPEKPTPVILASGDTLNVYRVKYWEYGDGSAPSLQLEYEAPLPMADTAGLRAFAVRVWPQFRPYVERMKLDGAILSATKIIRHRKLFGWRADFQHFGVVLDRDSLGLWTLHGQPVASEDSLPPLMVIEPDGKTESLLEGVPKNPSAQ